MPPSISPGLRLRKAWLSGHRLHLPHQRTVVDVGLDGVAADRLERGRIEGVDVGVPRHSQRAFFLRAGSDRQSAESPGSLHPQR